VTASCTRMRAKMRRMRELREKLLGWLIQSCVIAVARTSSAMIKFLVGSGCWPLKTRNASPPANTAKITPLMKGEYSRLRFSSLRARRRRVFREARPRLMSLPRLEKSNIWFLLAWRWRGRSVLLVSANNSAHQFMPHDVALGKIHSSDSRDSL